MANGSVVIGIRPYSFKPEDRDQLLEGVTLWLAEEQKGAFGLIPFKVSATKEKMQNILENAGVSDLVLLLNCKIDVSYDRYGKLSGLEVVEEP